MDEDLYYLENIQTFKYFLKFIIENLKLDSFNMNELNHWLNCNELTDEQKYYLLKILCQAQFNQNNIYIILDNLSTSLYP